MKEVSSRSGLKMNVKKKKTMITSRKPENKTIEIKVDNRFSNKSIKCISEISEEAKSEIEIERRTNSAKEKFSKIAHLWTWEHQVE